jgi:nucleoside 2-deoxyribosyltransferase
MKLFITASFKGNENKQEIEHICNIAKEVGFEDFCFIRDIENYQKTFSDGKKLMQRAKEEIAKSDALLIDLTNKPTGRAIEAGIAFALDKKIIIIAQKGTAMKETATGIADLVIEYSLIDDIIPPLREWLLKQ